VTSLLEWGNFCTPRALILMTPGVFMGVLMYLVLCHTRTPYALPCSMLFILAGFYSLLLISGASLEDAREYGWIAPLALPEPFYHSWYLYDISRVEWVQVLKPTPSTL
jgi:SulP family sulfate permease